MSYDLLLRERGTQRLIVGVPEGETDAIRARIETSNGDVITLAEVTLAALVQAYMDVFTHPTRQAIELRADVPFTNDPSNTAPRLAEVATDEAALRQELASGPPAEAAAGHEDVDEITTRPPATLPNPAGDFTGPLAIDDGPVFGDVPTQHSTPSPTDPHPSGDESGPAATADGSDDE